MFSQSKCFSILILLVFCRLIAMKLLTTERYSNLKFPLFHIAFTTSVADRFSRFALSNPQNVAQQVAVITESIEGDSQPRRQLLTNEEFNAFVNTDSFVQALQEESGFIQVYLRPAKGIERMYECI